MIGFDMIWYVNWEVKEVQQFMQSVYTLPVPVTVIKQDN